MTAEILLSEIDQFLARDDVKMAETTFGRLAVNDGKFVEEIRSGRRIWPETAEKVRAFIRDYQPSQAESSEQRVSRDSPREAAE